VETRWGTTLATPLRVGAGGVMNRSSAVLAVVLAAAVAACQRAPEQAAAPPSPNAPASSTLAPGVAPEAGAGQGLESTPATGASAASAPEAAPTERTAVAPRRSA